ncbi:MAG TPA: prolyl oligopeptidase family serine peptidase [Candidatus Limnocylindria bacterium]
MTETLRPPRGTPLLEAPWRKRFRAARIMFPSWARDDPDRLIHLSNESGKFEVHTWDRASGERRRLTDRSEGTGYRVPSRLEPSGQRVWWFDDAKGNELGRWVREPFAGGTREWILGEVEPAYSTGLALGTGVAVIGRSRGGEGSTVYVVRDGAQPMRIYAHAQSASVGAMSRDEQLFALAHSERGDSRNRAVRILDLDGYEVAELWDGPGRGLEPGDWSPVAGDQRLLVGHDREGKRRWLIYDVAAKHETAIAVDLPGEIAAARWYPGAKALLLVHEHRGRGELYRYDIEERTTTHVDAERGSIDAARVRPDGEVWYLLDRAQEPATVRSKSGEVVLRAGGAHAPAGVAYEDHDVEGVHVFVAKPPSPGPYPTYFLVHGGPEYHDRDAWSPTVQAWVDHGFAVVMVNYRGSSGYGKAWRDAIVGKPGLTELADIASAHEWAVRNGTADPNRCVLGGGSWGGYLTLLGLGTQPGRWAVGIGIVPIGDYVAAFEDEMEPLKRYDADLFGGTPKDVPEKYRVANPLTYIEKVQAPMLLLVGQNDPRCPSRSVDIYVERLKALRKPYEEYRYDAGHGSLVVDEQLKQVAMQIDFVSRRLGTQAAM